MLTFDYTYPKLLCNTTGTIPRGAKKQRLPQGQKHKDTQHSANDDVNDVNDVNRNILELTLRFIKETGRLD